MAKGSGGTRGKINPKVTSISFGSYTLRDIADTSVERDEFYDSVVRYIKSQRLDWKKESSLEYLNPSDVKPSEWNDATEKEGNKKVQRYIEKGGGKMPPIIAVKTENGYEAIDGIHRTWAAEKLGMKVPAIVISQRLADALSNDSIATEFLFNKYRNSIIKNRR